MRNAFKKAVSVLLVAVMLFGAAPLAGTVGIELPDFSFLRANAQTEEVTSGTCGENVTWLLTPDGNLIISGTGPMYDYIEKQADGKYLVTDAPWYAAGTEIIRLIKKITIENGVTSIGVGAFFNCENLESVTIPDSVRTIGEMAFLNCDRLKSVYIPASVTAISYIPEPISGGVSGYHAFADCSALESITVSEENPYFSSSEDGVLFNKDKTVLIQYPIGRESTSYTIPDSVTKINGYAFAYGENIKNITIPENVTSIGIQAFCYCYSLEEVTILGNITSMGEGAFASTSINTLTIDEGVEVIGIAAFLYCDYLKEVTIPESVESIGAGAFYACTSLETVEILDGATSIGDEAFYACTALENIIIPLSVETFGANILENTTSVIKYRGSEAQWNEIEKGENDFSNNTIIFGYGNNLVNVTDPVTGIIVSGLNGDDYDGMLSLQARECPEEEADITMSGFSFIFRKTKLYDITINCNGEAVQPTDVVTVRIPLPKGFSEKNVKIYYVNDETGEKEPIPSTVENGFVVFTIDHFSYYAMVEEYELDILNNTGSKTINYGETLELTAVVPDKPSDFKVVWYVAGEKMGEGETFRVRFESGTKTVEAKLVDSNGEAVKDASGNEISDSQTVTVNASFFQKIISFFKNLFRINRTVVQVFMG